MFTLVLAALAGCRREPAPTHTQRPGITVAACDSVYFPVHPGARWTYEIAYTGLPTPDDGGTVGGRFTQTVTDLRPGGFTLEQRWPYVAQSVPWACRPEGLVALERGGETTQFDREGHGSITFRTESVEGVNLPSPLPPAGESWNVTYRVRGEGNTRTGARIESHAIYSSTYTVEGPESVEVRGNRYDAVRLRVSTTIRTDATAADRPGRVSNTLTEEGSSWYAVGVGWVRSALRSHGARGDSVESTTELVRYDQGR